MTNIKLGDWDLIKKQIEDWVTCGLRNESYTPPPLELSRLCGCFVNYSQTLIKRPPIKRPLPIRWPVIKVSKVSSL